MSRTNKDLKSYRKGYGRYGHDPKRKLRLFEHDANKIVGDNEVLSCKPNNDINQDDFNKIGGHWYGSKQVRSIRKQLREERKYNKSRARTKIKRYDNEILKKWNTDQETQDSKL